MQKVFVYLQVEVMLEVDDDAEEEDILGDALVAYSKGDFKLSTMANGMVSYYDIVEPIALGFD
jgi:hypothetical protein